MTATARKYNPGFLDDDELVASFCVRTHEFDSLIEMLRECTGSANPHQIVIGPRGSGKTSLLLRVAAELRRDGDLSRRFFPVVFAEESYEIATAGEFWLQALSRLVAQAPSREDRDGLRGSWEALRTIRDDRSLAERCLGVLLDFADREGKRLVLLAENLNDMFADMVNPQDAGWRLRKTLQTEPRILLLASATSRFNAMDNLDQALYGLFRVLTLRSLDTDECAALWVSVSGQRHAPGTIRAMQILTGGSPRLLVILARFGVGLSFRDLMDDLLRLVDDHTEYFRSHLEALPAQERRVYLALADLWKPATAREIAVRARLDTSKCSAQLTRLTDRGTVEVTGGSPRRKLYYLTERLYNIYYLMRRARGPDPVVEALVRFMASYYAPDELKDIGLRIAREAGDRDTTKRSLYRLAFMQLVALPVIDPYREDLLGIAPPDFVPTNIQAESGRKLVQMPDLKAAQALFDRAFSLAGQHRFEEALVVCDEAMRRFGENNSPEVLAIVPRFLVYQAAIFVNLDQLEEAIEAYDETVHRFGNSEKPGVLYWVARALNGKGAALERMDRREQAIAVYDDAARRFEGNKESGALGQVIEAVVRKGIVLEGLDRWDEAIVSYDVALRRSENNYSPWVLEGAAKALVRKGNALEALGRFDEAVATFGEVVRRCADGSPLARTEVVASALVGKATLLVRLVQLEEALSVWEDVIRRFGTSETTALVHAVATAYAGQGITLGIMNRPEEALTAWDEVVRRLGTSETPNDLELVAMALVDKGETLFRLNRPAEAIKAWDEVIHRFGASDAPELREQVRSALLKRASVEFEQQRYREAAATAGQALERHGAKSPEDRWTGQLIRLMATRRCGDMAAYEREVAAILAVLPDMDGPPGEVLDALKMTSLVLGPERMRELIIASPAAGLLLPLTTALERDLGIEPRVAREVNEVADDIREDFRKLKAVEANAAMGNVAPQGNGSSGCFTATRPQP